MKKCYPIFKKIWFDNTEKQYTYRYWIHIAKGFFNFLLFLPSAFDAEYLRHNKVTHKSVTHIIVTTYDSLVNHSNYVYEYSSYINLFHFNTKNKSTSEKNFSKYY